MKFRWDQFAEAVFSEAIYGEYRNSELRFRRHPLPRGPQFLALAHEYLDFLVEQSAKPRIEIATH